MNSTGQSRRSFLAGLGGIVAAPAIVPYASLTPVRGIVMPIGGLSPLKPEPSEHVQGIPTLMRLYKAGLYDLQEAEGLARETEHRALVCASHPFYVSRAAREEQRRPGGAMDFWFSYCDTWINW